MNWNNQKELLTNSWYDVASTQHHSGRFALTREKRTACREDDFRVFLRRTSVLSFYRYFVPQCFSYPLSYFTS